MPGMIHDLASQVLAALEALPGIDAIVLFGSRARGAGRPDSDLDVALLPSAAPELDRRRLISAAAVALAHLAPGGRVDIVLLDEAPELLRHNVFATGSLLLCRDARRYRELRVATMREHGDREWAREIMIAGLHRRLTEGGSFGRPRRAGHED
jgi:predicted nucleotidyltransferase